MSDLRQEQQLLVSQQDEQLVALADTTDRIGQSARIINRELADQQIMIRELDEDLDREDEKMNFVMRRMGRLLRTSDGKTLWLVMALTLIFVALVILVVL
eukprot:Filipodium_phascolosomae@DN1990_c0_g1_i1.p2